MKDVKNPIDIFWKGKWRKRILRQVRFYNRVLWWKDEGKDWPEIKKLMFDEKVGEYRLRLDARDVHGIKRKRALTSKRRKIVKALQEHMGVRQYRKIWPLENTLLTQSNKQP